MNKEKYASLPEGVRDYLKHIGMITCEQDYLNKRVILGKLARKPGELELAIEALNELPGVKKEFIDKSKAA